MQYEPIIHIILTLVVLVAGTATVLVNLAH